LRWSLRLPSRSYRRAPAISRTSCSSRHSSVTRIAPQNRAPMSARISSCSTGANTALSSMGKAPRLPGRGGRVRTQRLEELPPLAFPPQPLYTNIGTGPAAQGANGARWGCDPHLQVGGRMNGDCGDRHRRRAPRDALRPLAHERWNHLASCECARYDPGHGQGHQAEEDDRRCHG